MKTIFILIAAALISFTAAAQSYTLQTVSLGTNAIPANTSISLPLVLSTTTITNPGTTAIFYTNTGYATNTVKFTLPATNTLYFTNSFIESNWVYGVDSKKWTLYETVHATNNALYYVTNKAWFTYSNGVVIATNAATTNSAYQHFDFATPVNFSITGTNFSTLTVTNFGASALDVTKSASAAVSVSFKLVSTNSPQNAVTFSYELNSDGNTLNTSPDLTFSLTSNGTTNVSTNINFTVGPFGFLNLTGITNGNAAALTNLVIKYGQKVQAP